MTRAAFIVAATLLSVTVVTAAIVRFAGVGAEARAYLRFTFAGPNASAAQLALHNGRIVAAVLLCAVAVPRVGRVRMVVDIVVGVVLIGNAVAVGVAVGAYGGRVANALSLHAPLELVALSLAGGALMQAHRVRLPVVALMRAGALSAVLLTVAGALESTQIGGFR